MRTWRTELRAGEAGITIIESMVAAAILLIGLLAAFLALDSASSAGKTAERQAIAAAVGERQMERMLAMSWSELAHCAVPDTSADPRNPLHHVKPGTPTRFAVLHDYRRPDLGPLSGTTAEGEVLVVQDPTTSPCDGSRKDAIFHGPIPFTSGVVTGSYYRFVSWRNDTCVPDLPDDLENLLAGLTNVLEELLTELESRVHTGVNAFCLQARDAKRLTVAVVIDEAGDFGPHAPTWVSTVQTNGDDGLIIDTDGRFDFPNG